MNIQDFALGLIDKNPDKIVKPAKVKKERIAGSTEKDPFGMRVSSKFHNVNMAIHTLRQAGRNDLATLENMVKVAPEINPDMVKRHLAWFNRKFPCTAPVVEVPAVPQVGTKKVAPKSNIAGLHLTK